MIFGILTTLLLLLVLFKFVTKRMKWKKADQILLKVHKITGILILVCALMHLYVVFPLFSTRPIIVWVLGSLSVFCMIVVAASYGIRKKLGAKWILIHRIGTLVIILLVICHIGAVVNSLSVYQKAVENIEFNNIELSSISDGVYEGEYDVGYIYARVEVTVHLGTITDIKILEHRNEHGTPAEALIGTIIEEQKIDVDAISGATNSSKVIKKAVENALLGEKTN
ncbi:MAG: FMN-binding protein [Lachnotalea sp.]